MELKLRHTWVLGEPVGGGGFGDVYAAKAAGRGPAVAKLVQKDPGARRELLFADDLTRVRNVVPVIDYGETADSWVLVMPRAEKSLREHLTEAGGPMAPAEAVAVLSDIAATLADLDGRVVHRDLKPDNVLLLDGHWCLADFGISRYAEATTGSETRKFSMTWEYAAPEQWRHERATTATDVYAFGVLGYEVLAGSRPFPGPGEHDFRRQHLIDSPPELTGVPPALEAIIEECLCKAAEARPGPSRLLADLPRAIKTPASPGMARLQAANHANVARRGERERQVSAQLSEAARREALVQAATQSLTRIADVMKESIMQTATSASPSTGLKVGWTIVLDQAHLRLEPPVTASPRPWGPHGGPVFEVTAFSSLSLQVPGDHDGYEGRSHSLWYCDACEAGRFQWFETAFMLPPLTRAMSRQEPFALNPGEDSGQALAAGMPSRAQIAWPFTPLSISDLADFMDRWTGWLADASEGRLYRPNAMPERPPKGSWRMT